MSLSLLQLLLLLLLLLCSCNGEVFTDTRDGEDAEVISRKPRPIVRDFTTDGQRFLRRFGYLDTCGGACTRQQVRDALRRFQANYELPATGAADARTLEAMNENRCGVGDGELALAVEESLLSATAAEASNATSVAAVAAAAAAADAAAADAAMRRTGRSRRSVRQQFRASSVGFSKKVITWKLDEFHLSRRMWQSRQKYVARLAFRMWSEVSPLLFKEEKGYVLPDITVGFYTYYHLNCRHPFDGRGGEVAHAQAGGNIHVDDDELLVATSHQNLPPPRVNLLRVLLHEIGHSLGLGHSWHRSSVMHPASVRQAGGLEIHAEDRLRVQRLYSECRARIDTIFDWYRRDQYNEHASKYNTYIFSCGWYWMYENRNRRPRYGDPKEIGTEWRRVPKSLDGVLQLSELGDASAGPWHRTYFFAGDKVYLYNNFLDSVEAGYPKQISSLFGAKSGSQHAVPNNIDSVFYSNDTKTIFFFKDEWVYEYDPVQLRDMQKDNCCERVAKIRDRFPTAAGHKALPLPLDAVYYSTYNSSLYFLSGGEFWQLAGGQLQHRGRVWDHWRDLCHVEQSDCDLSEF